MSSSKMMLVPVTRGKSRKQGTGGGSQSLRSRPNGFENIPRFNVFPVLQQIFEFVSTTNTASWGVQDSLNCLICCSTATAGFFFIDTAIVRLIQMWIIPSTNVFVDAMLEWAGTRAPGKIRKITSTPFNQQKIQESPPLETDASKWQTTAEIANSLATLSCTSGSTFRLRVHLSFTMSNVARVSGTAGTGATANTTNFNLCGSGNLKPIPTPQVSTQFS